MKKTVFLIFLFPILAFALNPAESLQKKLSQFRTFSADFQQTIQGEDNTVLQTSSGKIAVIRPGQFRWETMDPIKQLIVAKNDQSFLYEPDLQQVTETTLHQHVSTTPMMLLSNANVNLSQQFTIKMINQNQYLLIPKMKNESFTEIVITFENNKITQFKFKNMLDQTIMIRFSNIKLNASLSPKLFELKFPKGTDIIKT